MRDHHDDLSLDHFHHPKETQVSGINDSTCMEDSKDHHIASHQEDKSKHSAHCILVSQLPREIQHSQVLDGATMSLTQRREGAKWALTGHFWLVLPQQNLTPRNRPIHSHLQPHQNLNPSPVGSEILKTGGALSRTKDIHWFWGGGGHVLDDKDQAAERFWTHWSTCNSGSPSPARPVSPPPGLLQLRIRRRPAGRSPGRPSKSWC